MAEQIRQKDLKRIQQAQQDCARLKREEAQQKEAMRTLTGSRCPAIFSNPHVQAYATKAASELKGGGYLTSLSVQGVVQRFLSRVNSEIYNAETSASRVPWASTDRFQQAIKSVNLDTLQTCFPQLANLLADYRQRIHAQEKANAEVAAEARKPVNRLLFGYKRYAFVKYCNEVRQGYLMVYINDIELERARTAVKAIESDAVREDPNLNPDTIWKWANAAIKSEYVEQYTCQLKLNELLQQAAAIHPENSIIEKDF